MTMDLKVGDVVRLKTGGPKMTVERLSVNSYDDTKTVEAVWFTRSADGEWNGLFRDTFPVAILEEAPPPQGQTISHYRLGPNRVADTPASSSGNQGAS